MLCLFNYVTNEWWSYFRDSEWEITPRFSFVKGLLEQRLKESSRERLLLTAALRLQEANG